jgi:hypothetical protein
MAWLAALAEDEQAATDIEFLEEAMVEQQAAQGGGAENPEGLFEEMPEDPDEMVAWLERLSVQQSTPEAEPLSAAAEDAESTERTVMEMDTPYAALEEVELPADEAEALQWLSQLEMPKDDEQALAWLSDLALDEPPTGEAPSDETQLEDAIVILGAAEALYEQPAPVELGHLDEHDVEEMIVADMDVEEPELMAHFEDENRAVLDTAEVAIIAALTEDTYFEDEVADRDVQTTLLVSESFGEEGDEELAWLDTFNEPGAADIEPVEGEGEQPEPEVMDLMLALALDDESEGSDLIGAEAMDEVAAEVMDGDRLRAARVSLVSGDVDGAVNEYTLLVDEGEGLPFLIADLEEAFQQHGRPPKIGRLLGDAYYRNGQVHKAVEAYRQALDAL